MTEVYDPAFDIIKEDNARRKKGSGEDKKIEDELTAIYYFKSLKDTDEIYYWDENQGIYIKGAEWLIKQECMRLDPDYKSKDVTEVINHIIWANYVDRNEFDSQIEWIATGDGMLNLKTLETKPHSPEFMATIKIPHEYKPLPSDYHSLYCPCPKIMQFLHEVIASEDVETVLDFMAYCLWRGFPFHKYVLFNGSGRNGKGVTIDIFKALLGRHNISAESLQRILDNRFATAKLFGKMANIDADLSNEALKNTGQLKKLTGGDELPAEEKFMPAFHFKNYAKLLFSANIIPRTPDESDAFFARLIIINFLKQYLGDKADPWLIKKLTTKEEMEGLFSIVVARLPLVLERGIQVSDNSLEASYMKYIESSDPIRAFVEKVVDHTNNPVDIASKEEIYNGFTKFCNEKKLNPESHDTVSRRLIKQYGFIDKKMQNDGVRKSYWIGVKLKDYAKTEEGQDTL